MGIVALVIPRLPIPIERARELLTYDPNTGVLVWRQNRGRRIKAGDIAGSQNTYGRWSISIDGQAYPAHRIAWALYYGKQPSDYIDHIDRYPGNNKINNLREVTHSENIKNSDYARIPYPDINPEDYKFKFEEYE